jgi:hypothetical protein
VNRASIVVLTQDKSVSQIIGTKKTSLIPNDIRIKYPNLSIGSYVVEKHTTMGNLCNYFINIPEYITGVIVLCDNRLAHLGKELATPLFTVLFDYTFEGKSIRNYLGMVLSKVVRAFAAYSVRFDDQKTRKLLILPLRNFRSRELRQLHLLFRNGVRPGGNFSSSLDEILKALRDRQKPKAETNYRTTFIVDDLARYFEYGKDIHAQLETGVPPHNYLCAVAGTYRFGKRYDSTRHFNVSLQEELISGTFGDCHDVRADRSPRSHINMFPNDFFGQN